MLFTDNILKCISDESFEIFKHLPIYKKFNLTELPKIGCKKGSRWETIVCDYTCVKLEIHLDFQVSIEKIEIISKNNFAVVKTKGGNWYSNNSIIKEDKIKISDTPSSIVYEESFDNKTTVVFFTDKYQVMHKKEIPTDIVDYMG